MTVINASCLYPDRERPFVIEYLSDGTPCIVGSIAAEASTTEESLFVYSKHGGHTKKHPHSEPGKVLYEIHTGDFVLAYVPDLANDCLYIYSFYISLIGPILATGIPAVL
ncbi:MAG: hypothetical protein J6D17_00470 [Bacteroides sp.]|nr:hypothetical protein [Bacteroides sp.]